MSDYVPSPREFVAEQVRRYEASGGVEGSEIQGRPCVIVTHRGRRTGNVRKTPLIRVPDGERYILVASMGGAPSNPQWVYNLREDPSEKTDLSESNPAKLREIKRRLNGSREAAAPALGGARRKPSDFVTPQRWGHPDKK